MQSVTFISIGLACMHTNYMQSVCKESAFSIFTIAIIVGNSYHLPTTEFWPCNI